MSFSRYISHSDVSEIQLKHAIKRVNKNFGDLSRLATRPNGRKCEYADQITDAILKAPGLCRSPLQRILHFTPRIDGRGIHAETPAAANRMGFLAECLRSGPSGASA